MSVSQRLAEYAARNYERQAALTNNPRKQAKLRARAAEERRKAGLPQPGQAPPPPVTAGRPGAGMDAPTVRLGAVPPVSQPAGRPVEVREGGVGLRQKVQGAAVLLVAAGMLVGCLNWASSDSDGESTSTVAAGGSSAGSRYSAADVEACEVAGEQLREVGAIDLDRPADEVAFYTFAAAEKVQGVAVSADDRELTAVLQHGAEYLRDMGATAAPNLTPGEVRTQTSADEVFGAIVERCTPVLTES